MNKTYRFLNMLRAIGKRTYKLVNFILLMVLSMRGWIQCMTAHLFW